MHLSKQILLYLFRQSLGDALAFSSAAFYGKPF